MRYFWIVCFSLLSLMSLSVSGTTAAKAESCQAATDKFIAERKADDLAKIVDAYAVLIEKTTACSEHIVHCGGDSVARAYVEASYAKADQGGDLNEVRKVLEQGRSFGSPWQLLVGLGDTSFAQARQLKDATAFERAATEYQDALNAISEDPTCADFGEPSLPGPAEIEPIHKRMTEALLLAPEFDVIRTRDGNCGGVFLASVRGFTPTFRPIPINFVFAQAHFAPEGDRAASILLSCLKQENYRRVVLSGHTDSIGSDSYNMELSKRRLDAVASYLRAGGFKGELVLQPKGEGEPFQPDDPTAYTEDELNQLNRRVALRETDK
ncbi:OmpA family protein [Mesorhizobium sp. URHB0026]